MPAMFMKGRTGYDPNEHLKHTNEHLQKQNGSVVKRNNLIMWGVNHMSSDSVHKQDVTQWNGNHVYTFSEDPRMIRFRDLIESPKHYNSKHYKNGRIPTLLKRERNIQLKLVKYPDKYVKQDELVLKPIDNERQRQLVLEECPNHIRDKDPLVEHSDRSDNTSAKEMSSDSQEDCNFGIQIIPSLINPAYDIEMEDRVSLQSTCTTFCV